MRALCIVVVADVANAHLCRYICVFIFEQSITVYVEFFDRRFVLYVCCLLVV